MNSATKEHEGARKRKKIRTRLRMQCMVLPIPNFEERTQGPSLNRWLCRCSTVPEISMIAKIVSPASPAPSLLKKMDGVRRAL